MLYLERLRLKIYNDLIIKLRLNKFTDANTKQLCFTNKTFQIKITLKQTSDKTSNKNKTTRLKYLRTQLL